MTQHTLSGAQEKLLDKLSEGSAFFGNLRARYFEFGSMTDGQFDCFERAAAKITWQRSAPKVAGIPVRNKFRAGKVPRCATRSEFCPAVATAVVGQFGYCSEHIESALADYDEFIAARKAEREQDAAAEATGK
jgi:hypothetical protein